MRAFLPATASLPFAPARPGAPRNELGAQPPILLGLEDAGLAVISPWPGERERDRAAARRALACHRSQATEQEMNESFAALEHLWQGRVAFQEWRGGNASTDLF